MIRASFKASQARGALDKRARGFRQSLPEVMRNIGRNVAVSLATSTQPYGVGDGARRAGELATSRDIQRVYATPEKVFAAFPDRRKAQTWWQLMQQRQYARAQNVQDAHCPEYRLVKIAPFDGGTAHLAARKKGRVSARQRPVLVVQTTRNLAAYIKQETDRVGEGKAGWAACAKVLGSTRGLPQWVTRHVGKRSGGAVHENYSGAVFKVTLENQVTYAQDILSPGEKQVAVRIGLDRLLQSMITAERTGRHSE